VEHSRLASLLDQYTRKITQKKETDEGHECSGPLVFFLSLYSHIVVSIHTLIGALSHFYLYLGFRAKSYNANLFLDGGSRLLDSQNTHLAIGTRFAQRYMSKRDASNRPSCGCANPRWTTRALEEILYWTDASHLGPASHICSRLFDFLIGARHFVTKEDL
jgi:hypothetical protein